MKQPFTITVTHEVPDVRGTPIPAGKTTIEVPWAMIVAVLTFASVEFEYARRTTGEDLDKTLEKMETLL